MIVPQKNEKLEKYTDEELMKLSQQGDKEAIEEFIRRYITVCIRKSSFYYVKVGDIDDMIQNALLGVLDSIKYYDETKGKSVKNFTSTCIDSRIKTFLTFCNRIKNKALNNSKSLNSLLDSKKVSEDGDSDNYMLRSSYIEMKLNEYNPENIILQRESFEETLRKIKSCLTDLEYEVLILKLDGNSYKDISMKTGYSVKKVDNALNRAYKKCKRIIKENKYGNIA